MCVSALNRALKLRPELPSKGAVAGDCKPFILHAPGQGCVLLEAKAAFHPGNCGLFMQRERQQGTGDELTTLNHRSDSGDVTHIQQSEPAEHPAPSQV